MNAYIDTCTFTFDFLFIPVPRNRFLVFGSKVETKRKGFPRGFAGPGGGGGRSCRLQKLASSEAHKHFW